MPKKISLALVLFLTACTYSMWSTKPHYEEKILGFYLAEDKDSLFAIGENYGYRFDVDSDFRRFVEQYREDEVKVILGGFGVNERNEISGHLLIRSNTSNSSGSKRAEYKKYLRGERYQITAKNQFTKLKSPLVTNITRPAQGTDTLKKMAITPFTIAYDVFVTPVFVVLFFLTIGE